MLKTLFYLYPTGIDTYTANNKLLLYAGDVGVEWGLLVSQRIGSQT